MRYLKKYSHNTTQLVVSFLAYVFFQQFSYPRANEQTQPTHILKNVPSYVKGTNPFQANKYSISHIRKGF